MFLILLISHFLFICFSYLYDSSTFIIYIYIHAPTHTSIYSFAVSCVVMSINNMVSMWSCSVTQSAAKHHQRSDWLILHLTVFAESFVKLIRAASIKQLTVSQSWFSVKNVVFLEGVIFFTSRIYGYNKIFSDKYLNKISGETSIVCNYILCNITIYIFF